MKRLVDLNPRWLMSGGEGVSDAAGNPVPERHGVGLACDCPCGCGNDLAIIFANPFDGGPPVQEPAWQRTGDTFETLTLSPSILRLRGCPSQWHGFLRAGVMEPC